MMNMKLCILEITFGELVVKWVHELIILANHHVVLSFFPTFHGSWGKVLVNISLFV
jgi:hypothetical protein